MAIEKAILIAIWLLGTWAACAQSAAQSSCANPQPIFGRIVAICGNDRMITYVGDETAAVLGIRTHISRFEVALCRNGGDRLSLNLTSNSEGYELKSKTDVYDRGISSEQIVVSHMWGEFTIRGVGYDGQPYSGRCRPYNDTRTNIEYLY